MEGGYRLPEGFLLGAATSSHQVEGNNRWNDWWAAEEAGRLPHRSGAACRHYDLFELDLDLAREAGHNAHRFSIEWSRVERAPGVWDPAALEHYRQVIRACTARGIEPIVTLQHFTLPLWAARRGGWSNPASCGWFHRYAGHVARELGDGVRYWITINEPSVCLKHGYVTGDWPPQRRRSWARGAVAFFNMARAHRAGRQAIRRHWPHALVGFAHSAPLVQPCDPARRADRISATLRDVVLNRAFFRLMGARPGRRAPFDFIGLNYYTRTVVRGSRSGLIPFAGSECQSDHHADRGPRMETGWEVYPRGMVETLRRFSGYGVPLLITENGIATTNETQRTSFLLEHLAGVGRALEEGIDVRGYMYWTLMDNYEWTLGTTARFGLYGVDFVTQERSARSVVGPFREICRSRFIPQPPTDGARTGVGSLS